jgi:predicted nucleotidyltransferase
VFREFLNEPIKKWHIRGLSRKIKIAPTSVKLHVNTLQKEGFVLEKNDDVFKYYVANFDSEDFRFYKKINTMINLRTSGLLDYIIRLCSPDTIILFGSCSKGEDTETSDLDLYIQGTETKLNLNKFEKLLNRKIQLFFSEAIEKIPKELRNNILNGIKLDGYVKVF